MGNMRRKRMILAVAGAGLLILAVIVSMLRSDGGTERSIDPLLQNSPTGSVQPPAPEGLVQGGERQAGKIEQPASGSSGPGAPEEFAAEIRVECETGAGSTPQPFPCRIMLRADGKLDGTMRDAPDGTWRGRLTGVSFHVAGIQGKDSVPELIDAPALTPATPKIRVLVRPSHSWTLEVVDAMDGTHLRGISLYGLEPTRVHASEAMLLATSNPNRVPEGKTVILVQGVVSPVTIPEAIGSGIFWVAATDHAPQVIQRNANQRSVRITLSRTGSIQLVMTRAFDDFLGKGIADRFPNVLKLPAEFLSHPIIRVSKQDSASPIVDEPIDSALARTIPDLPVGKYAASVGYWRGVTPLLELWRQEFVVEADLLTRIVMTPPDKSSAVEVARLKAMAVLPIACDRKRWKARLSRMREGSWESVSEESLSGWTKTDVVDSYEHTFDYLPVGKYRLQVVPTGHSVEFELEAQGGTEILDCSDTCEVSIAAKIPAEGKSTAYTLWWGYLDAQTHLTLGPVLQPGESQIRLTAQCRPLRLQLVGLNSASEMTTVTPKPGKENQVGLVVGVGNLALVRISAWRSTSHTYADWGYWSGLTTEPVGGAGSLVYVRYGDNGTDAAYGPGVRGPDWSQAVLVFTSPGRYRVKLPGHTESMEWEVPAGVSDRALVVE